MGHSARLGLFSQPTKEDYRALCSNPEMLVLDEPESSLEFKNQLIVLETIQRLAKEQGIAAIVNTHYLAHARIIRESYRYPFGLSIRIGNYETASTQVLFFV